MNGRAKPRPNCTEEVAVGTIEFGRLGRRAVEGGFDGCSMTSNGGVILLGQLDRELGQLETAARCITDPRSPLLIKHAVRDMLSQRVYGLALGWEDLNNHAALCCDVAMQTAVGGDREVASAPTRCAGWLSGLIEPQPGACTSCWSIKHRQLRQCAAGTGAGLRHHRQFAAWSARGSAPQLIQVQLFAVSRSSSAHWRGTATKRGYPGTVRQSARSRVITRSQTWPARTGCG